MQRVFKILLMVLISLRAEASTVVLVQAGLEDVGLKIENRLIANEPRILLSRVNFSTVSPGRYQLISQHAIYSETGLSITQWQSFLSRLQDIRSESQKLLAMTNCTSILMSTGIVAGALFTHSNLDWPTLITAAVIAAITPQTAYVALTSEHFTAAQLAPALQQVADPLPSPYLNEMILSQAVYEGLERESLVYSLTHSEKILSIETLGFGQHRGSFESALSYILK